MIPENKFDYKELVQPEIYEVLSPDACYRLVGGHVLKMLNRIRTEYANIIKCVYPECKPVECAIVINGMWCGEEYRHSGVRTWDCTEGAEKSNHKKGFAFDLKVRHIDILWMLINTHSREYCIRRVEDSSATLPKGYIHVEFCEYKDLPERLIKFLPK